IKRSAVCSPGGGGGIPAPKTRGPLPPPAAPAKKIPRMFNIILKKTNKKISKNISYIIILPCFALSLKKNNAAPPLDNNL
ncbi:hypothetical protein, partial [Enterobacter hormaechei]